MDNIKKSEMVEISARESYMINDVFHKVFAEMVDNGEDYLFCNYSRKEIADLANKFGEMNLRNDW